MVKYFTDDNRYETYCDVCKRKIDSGIVKEDGHIDETWYTFNISMDWGNTKTSGYSTRHLYTLKPKRDLCPKCNERLIKKIGHLLSEDMYQVALKDN